MKLTTTIAAMLGVLETLASEVANDETGINWDLRYVKGDIEDAHNIWLNTGQNQFGNFFYEGNPKIEGPVDPVKKHGVEPPRFEDRAWDCQEINEWDPMTNFVLKMADALETRGGYCHQPYKKARDRRKTSTLYDDKYGKIHIHGWHGELPCEEVAIQLRILAEKCVKALIDPYDRYQKMRNRTGGVIYLENFPKTYTWLSVATHTVV